MILDLCVKSKKYNKKNAEINTENKLVVTSEEKEGGGTIYG